MRSFIVLFFMSVIFLISGRTYSMSEEELFESRYIFEKSECMKLGNPKEIHMIIIWSLSTYKQKEILDDIKKEKDLEILDVYKAAWKKETVHENFNKLYELKNIGPQKEKDSGGGPFIIVMLLDTNPVYEVDRYKECNNKKLLNLKHKYRKLTGVRWGVHATACPAETEQNLMYLLNVHYDSYLEKEDPWDGKIKDLGIIND